MDEQKIQLESRNDFEFVRSQFLTHLKGLKDCGKFSMEQIEMFTDKVFEVVQKNIQIDGENFEDSTQVLEMEPLDESLEVKLQEMQIETDALLVQVTDYRKKYPQIAAKNYALSLEKALTNLDHTLASVKPLISTESPKDLPDGLLIDYSFKMEKFQQLRASIPEVVAKLQRARQVLKEEGSKAMKSSASLEDATENLSDLINCQRRVERQLDLATKIINQF